MGDRIDYGPYDPSKLLSGLPHSPAEWAALRQRLDGRPTFDTTVRPAEAAAVNVRDLPHAFPHGYTQLSGGQRTYPYDPAPEPRPSTAGIEVPGLSPVDKARIDAETAARDRAATARRIMQDISQNPSKQRPI